MKKFILPLLCSILIFSFTIPAFSWPNSYDNDDNDYYELSPYQRQLLKRSQESPLLYEKQKDFEYDNRNYDVSPYDRQLLKRILR